MLNAEQSMPTGGIIRICVKNVDVESEDGMGLLLKEGKYIKISVQDQGIGIKEENLQKIFDPYFTTKQKGSGFGLAITYSIIKRHEGYISVESKVGLGTTFHIYLSATQREMFKMEDVEKEKFRFSRR